MENTSGEQKPTGWETLLGGMKTLVQFRDPKFAAEEVQVRQLAIEHYPELLKVMDDECAMVEMFCGKEKGWAVSLTPDSFERVITEGERLNGDFFSRWVQRRQKRAEQLMPGALDKVVNQAMREATKNADDSRITPQKLRSNVESRSAKP